MHKNGTTAKTWSANSHDSTCERTRSKPNAHSELQVQGKGSATTCQNRVPKRGCCSEEKSHVASGSKKSHVASGSKAKADINNSATTFANGSKAKPQAVIQTSTTTQSRKSRRGCSSNQQRPLPSGSKKKAVDNRSCFGFTASWTPCFFQLEISNRTYCSKCTQCLQQKLS